jgi:hypothetical protein
MNLAETFDRLKKTSFRYRANRVNTKTEKARWLHLWLTVRKKTYTAIEVPMAAKLS